MICDKCKGMIVLHAFSTGECKLCKKEVVTPHIPCYKLCESCAEETSKCEQCSTEIKK